jgi:hypothetical protein
MCFHLTAIIFVPFYIFQRIKLSRRLIVISLIIYFISLFITIPVITMTLKALAPLTGGVLGDIINKGVRMVIGFDFARSLSFTSILNLAFLGLLAANIKKLSLSPKEALLIKMFLFSMLIMALFKEIQEVADRFSYYFAFGTAMMFSLLVDLIRVKERKQILMTVPILFILMRLFLTFRSEAILYGLTPYRNYFFVSPSDEPVILDRYDKMQTIAADQSASNEN